ncbi:probable transporter Mch4p [[Candida] railenensis]|uniref:Probable transporter Mch4p n=1 Tax=[Candida] railenensis TaxID=45579 RepID=A0A9P0VYG2_9ASCO|nr:probable transporter Mch4p [[Candida] railenensis]
MSDIALESLSSNNGVRRRRTIEPELEHNPSSNLMYGSEKNPEIFPDGGFEAYVVVFGSFVGLMADFGIPNSLGAIESYVSTHQLKGVEVTSLSWIFSIHLGVMFFGGAFIGGVFDKYGARIPLIVGTALMCLGLFLTAECQTVYQFILSFGVLTALGISIATQPLISAISHWFLKKRAMACSIATAGGLVGSSIFAVMLQSMYVSIGFKWAIRILALICLFCMVVSIFLVRGRAVADQFRVQDTEDIESTKESKLTIFINFVKSCVDFSVAKDIKFILLTLSVAISELASVCTTTYLSSYALQQGVNEKSAYLLITVIGVCGIPSRLTSGWIADKYGRFNVMIGTSVILTISIFGFWLPAGGNLGVLYAFGVVFGVANSAIISLVPACCGQICSVENFGKVYGTLYFFLTFTTILGMYCASVVIGTGASANYSNLIYYEGGLAVVSIITWTTARYFAIGWKWGKF